MVRTPSHLYIFTFCFLYNLEEEYHARLAFHVLGLLGMTNINYMMSYPVSFK